MTDHLTNPSAILEREAGGLIVTCLMGHSQHLSLGLDLPTTVKLCIDHCVPFIAERLGLSTLTVMGWFDVSDTGIREIIEFVSPYIRNSLRSGAPQLMKELRDALNKLKNPVIKDASTLMDSWRATSTPNTPNCSMRPQPNMSMEPQFSAGFSPPKFTVVSNFEKDFQDQVSMVKFCKELAEVIRGYNQDAVKATAVSKTTADALMDEAVAWAKLAQATSARYREQFCK